MNAWNNKTFDKILTPECQETTSKLTSVYREYDKQMFINDLVQSKKRFINNGKKRYQSPIQKNLTKHLFLTKRFIKGVWQRRK